MMATELALEISKLPIEYQILIFIGSFIFIILCLIIETTTSEKK